MHRIDKDFGIVWVRPLGDAMTKVRHIACVNAAAIDIGKHVLYRLADIIRRTVERSRV